MSKAQPFCDRSHMNTEFKPLNFKLAEKCNTMLLCGCKLTKKAPFCDGQTCVDLRRKENGKIKIFYF